MSGLRDLWGLGDAASGAAAPTDARAVFEAAIGAANDALRSTAVAAPTDQHGPLAARRDAAYRGYSKAAATGADTTASIEEAKAVAIDARRLLESADASKAVWDAFSSARTAIEDSVAQGAEPAVDAGLAAAVSAANGRDFGRAVELLRPLVGVETSSTASSAGPNPGGPKPRGPKPGGPEKKYPLLGPLPSAPQSPTDERQLEGWQNPLVEVDPRKLFTAERMDDVAAMGFAGEGDPALNEAMERLAFLKPGNDPQPHLDTIARVRGLSPSQVGAQYQRYLQLQSVSRQMESTRGLGPDDAPQGGGAESLGRHPEFLGSRNNLRYGQVVGEATGLDPAFAGMLNPTGGMVGPGMMNLAPTDADSPVVSHGVFHDAGGYLLNYQNSGPGYTYLPDTQTESGRAGGHPIQGQVEGISYWYERRDPKRSVFEDLQEIDPNRSDFDTLARGPIADAEQWADEATASAVDEVERVANESREAFQARAGKLKAATTSVADGVRSATDSGGEAVDGLAAKARELGVAPETVDAAQGAIDAQLDAVRERVTAWQTQLIDGIDAASAATNAALDGVVEWATDARDAVNRKVVAVGHEAEQSAHDALVGLAQDEDVTDFARQGVNGYTETAATCRKLKAEVARRVESAKAEALALYERARDAASQAAHGAVEAVAGLKDGVDGKLDEVVRLAARGSDAVASGIDVVTGRVEETGQDVRDAAGGVVDSLADAVNSGADSLANALDTATDAAAEKLERLTTLFG
ncbi:MAG: hypothetical protein ACRCT8_03780 [Lacipirellulaceae bacterium]